MMDVVRRWTDRQTFSQADTDEQWRKIDTRTRTFSAGNGNPVASALPPLTGAEWENCRSWG